MRYKLTGSISVRESPRWGDISKEHTEVVEAESEEEAVELSLGGFEEWEDPTWDTGYPVITLESTNVDKMQAELDELRAIPYDADVDWEYIRARMDALSMDISGYYQTRAIIQSAGTTEDMDDATYFNTIACYNDQVNGDM